MHWTRARTHALDTCTFLEQNISVSRYLPEFMLQAYAYANPVQLKLFGTRFRYFYLTQAIMMAKEYKIFVRSLLCLNQ